MDLGSQYITPARHHDLYLPNRSTTAFAHQLSTAYTSQETTHTLFPEQEVQPDQSLQLSSTNPHRPISQCASSPSPSSPPAPLPASKQAGAPPPTVPTSPCNQTVKTTRNTTKPESRLLSRMGDMDQTLLPELLIISAAMSLLRLDRRLRMTRCSAGSCRIMSSVILMCRLRGFGIVSLVPPRRVHAGCLMTVVGKKRMGFCMLRL
jgi:hypothetical protein